MRLRRISENLDNQNWLAVLLDFVIVVSGVFIGLQVANWSEDRADKDAAINALERLRGEVVSNLDVTQGVMDRLQSTSETRIAGVDALNTCEETEEGLSAVAGGVGAMTSDILPSLVGHMADQLARQDRYAAYLSDDFLSELNSYNGRLTDEADQLKINFRLMWDHHISNNPYVGIRSLAEELDPNNPDFVTIVFDQPMRVLCTDTRFVREYVMTNVWHESTKLRLGRFKSYGETFLDAVDTELAAIR